MHPCRKLVINKTDLKIFALLKERESISLEDLLQALPEIEKKQLEKRLVQLKKHKRILCDSNFQKIRILN